LSLVLEVRTIIIFNIDGFYRRINIVNYSLCSKIQKLVEKKRKITNALDPVSDLTLIREELNEIIICSSQPILLDTSFSRRISGIVIGEWFKLSAITGEAVVF